MVVVEVPFRKPNGSSKCFDLTVYLHIFGETGTLFFSFFWVEALLVSILRTLQ